jgi:magnesium transporter
MHFELTKEYLDSLKLAIEQKDEKLVNKLILDLHPADIAEIFDEIDIEEAKFIYINLDKDIAADLLVELDEDVREQFLEHLSNQEIAAVFIDNMDSDDAADVIGELPEERQEEILSHISDVEQAGDIVDLLNYDEDTAGGLMATELIAVNENLTVAECLDEIRKQAEGVDDVFFVYIIKDNDTIKGILPLQKLIQSPADELVKNICNTDIIYVKTDTSSEDVANIMNKYDLVALPVVDSIGRLKGRITIDDVVDVIKEEAEKDYQMISGISSDVETSDNIFRLTKARVPWLLIGLFGGTLSSRVLSNFGDEISLYPAMAFFIPMITATGGNVGIQSSSIVVQSLANKTLGFETTIIKLFKELGVAIATGTFLGLLAFGYNFLIGSSSALTFSVSVALFAVIVFSSLFGTFVPLALNKIKIDPALATGPFITTTNDLTGLFIYFWIGKIFFSYFI